MVEVDGLDIPVRVEKTEDGIKVVYGVFSVRDDIVIDMTNFLEPEEILDLERTMEGDESFLTKTWLDVPSYINITTSLFEAYGEEMDKGKVVPDDESLLELRRSVKIMSEEEFIDKLYELFGVI